MNEIRLHDKQGRCEIIVRIGDRFQAVEIKKTADRHDIVKELRIWADNIERDKLMAADINKPPFDPSCCGNCLRWRSDHDGAGHGWCQVTTRSIHKNDIPCTHYQRKDTES